jgi:hypothetical protein
VDVILRDVKLSLSDVPAVLPLREIAVSFDLPRSQYPIPDYVCPYSYPDKHITTVRLQLLKVHQESLTGIRRKSFGI